MKTRGFTRSYVCGPISWPSTPSLSLVVIAKPTSFIFNTVFNLHIQLSAISLMSTGSTHFNQHEMTVNGPDCGPLAAGG